MNLLTLFTVISTSFCHISAIGPPNLFLNNKPVILNFTASDQLLISHDLLEKNNQLQQSMFEIDCHKECMCRPKMEPLIPRLQISCSPYTASWVGR